MTDDELNEKIAKDGPMTNAWPNPFGMFPSAYEFKVLQNVVDAWKAQRAHGFDLKHDLSHADGELSRAAAGYALHGSFYASANGLPSFWPWLDGFNPKSRRENLLRAAAFLLSEIVRLDAETEYMVVNGHSTNESSTPTHCVQCGHITRLLPRPEQCPDCGSSAPWGSPSCPFPDGDKAANARRNWRREKAKRDAPAQCPINSPSEINGCG